MVARKLFAAAALVAAAAMVGAGGAPTVAQTPKMGGRLTVAFYTDAPIPDPQKTRDLTSHTVMKHVVENLVTFDDDYNVIPQLAESWQASADGKTFVFVLRKGVKFHNGKEFDAEDVRYSLERLQRVSPNKGDYAGIQSVTVRDPHTVEVTLKSPSPVFLTALAGPFGGFIIPKDLEKDQGGEIKKPIGTGPFEYVEWQPDRFLRLRKFKDYAADARFKGPTGLGGNRTAMVDEILFRIVPDRSSRVTAVETGEVDFTLRLDVTDFDRLKRNRQVTAIETPTLEWVVLWLGTTLPPTNDLKFRQAVAAALDYDEIIQIAINGRAVVNPAFMHPTQKAWYTDKTGLRHKHDPEAAKRLLRDSGYKGEPLNLFSNKEVEYMGNAALAMQQQLGKVGIKTEVKYMDMSGLVAHIYATQPTYQLGMMTSSGRYDPDQHYYRRLHSSGAVNKWNNPEFDKLVERARVSLDPKERMALYDQAQEIIMREVPCILLFNPSFFDASRSFVKGYSPIAMGIPRFWNVWLDK
ncbi:MAG: ABC transporter substrate-binding protein [Alphaproteobacteria bacterium]|nr:ABC transporter substrate-binding protein [Alphaproteobacteria bacterium]